MTLPSPPSDVGFSFRRLLGGAASGALAGAGFAVVLLGIGLLRFLFALAMGRTLEPPGAQDVRLILGYVALLATAGTAVGAVRSHFRGALATYLVCGGAGAAFMLGLNVLDEGRLLEGGFTLVLAFIGMILGVVAAHSLLKPEP